jgi:hypothetical protein
MLCIGVWLSDHNRRMSSSDQPERPSVVEGPDLIRGTVSGGLLVILGWYATVIAAIFVGVTGLPEPPRTDCSAMFSCISRGAGLALVGAIVGVPFFLGSFVIATITVILLMRRLRSAVVAGTIAAAVGIGAVGLGIVVWAGMR